MDSLPDDVIFQTSLEANLEEIEKLSKTSKKVKQLIETVNFWKRKYLKDIDTDEDMQIFKKLLFNKEKVENLDSIAYRWGYIGKTQNINAILSFGHKGSSPFYFLKGYMESSLCSEAILRCLVSLVANETVDFKEEDCLILVISKVRTSRKAKVIKLFYDVYGSDIIDYIRNMDTKTISDRKKKRLIRKIKGYDSEEEY